MAKLGDIVGILYSASCKRREVSISLWNKEKFQVQHKDITVENQSIKINNRRIPFKEIRKIQLV